MEYHDANPWKLLGYVICPFLVIPIFRKLIQKIENRLEYELNNNMNYCENLESSESNIRDTDMAKKMSENAKHNLLIQASQAMLAQANQTNRYVLNLLQQ